MRKITKISPPDSFIEYKKKERERASYSEMDKHIKDDLNISLLNEQGWVCGYCQRKINIDNMQIEHHCEQSICNGEDDMPDKRLDYNNLLAVCSGKSGYFKHCDSQKATKSKSSGLPINILPWSSSHMNMIKYSSSGKISSANEKHQREIDEVLNLNISYLKELRKDKWIILFKNSKTNKELNLQKMKRILEKDLDISNKKFPNNFPGLSEYLLRKYC